ncbi:hypothetical protein AX16_008375 [Volvariella volvacea WC 439]|nr:hypothetical protein AX16_008375 [Volvariella volvacea WC 439]
MWDEMGHEYGTNRIPSIVYYAADGRTAAIGRHATSDKVEADAKQSRWAKAEWFKHHIKPDLKVEDVDIPPLPPNKTAAQVFASILLHLYDLTMAQISREVMHFHLFLQQPFDTYLTISHPNGWEEGEHDAMRSAASLAGIAPEDQARIILISESSALLHAILFSQHLSTLGSWGSFTKHGPVLPPNSKVAIIDAGGSTISISAYEIDGTPFSEIITPECHFEGASHVTLRANEYFKEVLADTPYIRNIDEISRYFDNKTKLEFSKADMDKGACYTRVRSMWDNITDNYDVDDPEIRSGKLKIPAETMASFFEPALRCIEDSIMKILSKHDIKFIYLFGGFFRNLWLTGSLQDKLRPLDITTIRLERHIQTAVAEGGIIQAMGLNDTTT